MKNVFFGLAALATVVAGYFTAQTQSLVKEQLQQKESVEKLFDTRKTDLVDAKKRSELEDERRLKAVGDLQKTISELRNLQIAVESNEGTLKVLEGDLAALVGKIGEREATLNEAKLILDEMFPGENVSFDELESRFEELEETLAELKSQRDELDLLFKSAQDSVVVARKEIDRRSAKQLAYQSKLRQNTLSGTVTAVNSAWGFAVVNLGMNDGIDPDGELLVVRGGQRVGRLQLSSIESGQSIANIDFDSLSAGQSIRPGDKVILAEPNRGN